MATDFSKYGKPLNNKPDQEGNLPSPKSYGTDFSKYGKYIDPSKRKQTIQEERQDLIERGLPVSVNEDNAEPTLAGNIIRGFVKAPVKLGLSVPAAFTGDKGVTVKSKYLGDTSDLSKSVSDDASRLAEKVNKGEISKGRAVLGAVGSAALNTADAASVIPAGGAIESAATSTAKAIAGRSVKETLKEGVKGVGKSFARGAGTGALYDAGAQAASGEKFNPEQTLKSAALGGALDVGLTKAVPGAINAFKSVPEKLGNQSSKILDRLSKTTPNAQKKFEQLAGETQGQYLERRGIFGNKESIVKKLYDRFTVSKAEADQALASLEGNHKATPVQTALEELFDREKRVSAPGALSPDLERVGQLKNKHDGSGLTMSEINEVKRLYERNVKLDFLKQNLPEGVARANNIDNALRKWQFATAEKLGLKNLPEINKETQLARQLMDDIAKSNIGKTGNNAIPLSDWIILSGSDPKAIGLYLAKKVLSNESVQGLLAKLLSRKSKVGNIKAQYGGVTGLPALIPGRDYRTATPMRGESIRSTIEPRAQKVNRSSSRYDKQKLLPPGKPGIIPGSTIRLPKSIRRTNLGLD